MTDRRRGPEKTIDFLFDPAVLPTLKAQGFNAFSQANNHAFDQGRPGFEDSRSRLQAAGFLVFGEQVRDDEIALATTTVNGLRLAFLGYNTTDNPLDKTAASRVIKDLRPQVDRIIVFTHWGPEYKSKPHPNEVALAKWFIDEGADVVIGGHPHWYQGIESYKGKPIVYSLGNFVFDQDFSLETRQGLAVGVTFRGDRIILDPIPIQIDASQPRVVAGAERWRRLLELADRSDASLREQVVAGSIRF